MADISDYAWFVRDLPASASSVLLGKSRLYAGDWDGNLCCWSDQGDLLWTTQAEDRVERMCGASEAKPPFICVTAGSKVNCIDAASGEERWNHQLIGSSDLVTCSDDGNRILATSSVYEIELNDFIESTCWRFDGDGEIVRQDTFEERPWHLILDQSGAARMGLGRPRCGLIMQTDDEITHLNLAEDDPILCGATTSGKTVFGHASGIISLLSKNGKKMKSLFDDSEESVLTLQSDGKVVIAGGDDGIARAISCKGGEIWAVDLGQPLDECTIAFEISGEKSCWVATWNGIQASLRIIGSESGKVHAEFDNLPRIHTLASRGDRVAVGMNDGRVMLFNQELFSRRISGEDNEQGVPIDEGDSSAGQNRLSLQEKLRSLRK